MYCRWPSISSWVAVSMLEKSSPAFGSMTMHNMVTVGGDSLDGHRGCPGPPESVRPRLAHRDPDAVLATAIVTMDAVGIDAVLIAETHGMNAQLRPALGTVLPNGAVRARYPFSERAVAAYPDRFAYMLRSTTPTRTQRLVAEVNSRPGALSLRVVPVVDTGEVDQFEQGAFESLFAAAEREGVRIFARLPAVLMRSNDTFRHSRN